MHNELVHEIVLSFSFCILVDLINIGDVQSSRLILFIQCKLSERNLQMKVNPQHKCLHSAPHQSRLAAESERRVIFRDSDLRLN